MHTIDHTLNTHRTYAYDDLTSVRIMIQTHTHTHIHTQTDTQTEFQLLEVAKLDESKTPG